MDKYNFPAERIYNCDETGISVVPKSLGKIVATGGAKQVGNITATERGETVTAEIFMSAAGSFMPMMLIFPRVKENKDFLKDAPPGAWATFHKSGWMQSEIFTQWFSSSKESPVLLLLDGHSSHTKNLDVINMAQESGVEILCFPPHCSHRLQPLDVTFMKPLSLYYADEVMEFQRNGARVQMKHIFSLLGKAFLRAAKNETSKRGFEVTGIFTRNSKVFKAKDFTTASREEMFTATTSADGTSDANINENVAIIKNLMKPTREENESSSPQIENIPSSVETLTNNYTVNNNSSESDQILVPKSIIASLGPMVKFFNSYMQASCDQTVLKCITNHQEACASQNFVIEETSEVQGDLDNDVNFNCDKRVLKNITNHQEACASREFATEETSQVQVDLINDANFNKENVAVKRKRAKGVSAVITSDQYKENLISSKSIKKETFKKQTKAKKPKIDNIVAYKVASLQSNQSLTKTKINSMSVILLLKPKTTENLIYSQKFPSGESLFLENYLPMDYQTFESYPNNCMNSDYLLDLSKAPVVPYCTSRV